MIKFNMPNTDISTLSPELLQHLDWKALSGADLKNSSSEFVTANFVYLSARAQRVVIADGKIGPDALTDEEWVSYFRDTYNVYEPGIFEKMQFNYSTLVALLKDANHRYIYPIARTQQHAPVDIVVANHSAANIAIRSGNVAVIDYIIQNKNKFTVHFLNNLQYLKSTEAKALGLTVKNRKISDKLLERAGACSNGRNYFKRVLKDVDSSKTSITWNEIIDVLRSNTKYRYNDTFVGYVDWLIDNRNED